MNRRRKILRRGSLGLGLLFILYFSFPAGAAEPLIIRYADGSKPDTSRTRAAQETMLEIEKRTGGRVKHEFYWAESLMKAKDLHNGIKSGACDVGYPISIIYHQSRFPVWQFSQLLFAGGDDQYAITRAGNELYDTHPVLKKEIDEQGMQLLTVAGLTPTLIISKMALREPEDFKGVRIRTTGPVAKFIAALGGIPSPLPYHEISEGFARGLLDGAQTYIYTCHAWRHYEYCKYLLMTGISHILVDYWINKDTLKKMPPDVRGIYLDTWRDFFLEKTVKYHDEDTERQIGDFKKSGVTLYNLTGQQLSRWKQVAEPINATYFQEMQKRGVDGQKILQDYAALYRKYERKR